MNRIFKIKKTLLENAKGALHIILSALIICRPPLHPTAIDLQFEILGFHKKLFLLICTYVHTVIHTYLIEVFDLNLGVCMYTTFHWAAARRRSRRRTILLLFERKIEEFSVDCYNKVAYQRFTTVYYLRTIYRAVGRSKN